MPVTRKILRRQKQRMGRLMQKRIKVCALEFDEMMQFDEVTGHPKGLFHRPVSYTFENAKKIINFTMVTSQEENQLINKETGEYSGCFGKLQKGEADMAIFQSVMPLIGIKNITQLNVTISESGMYLVSPYSTQGSTHWTSNDLLSLFQAVSLEVWTYSFLLTIYFWTLLTALKRLYRLAKRARRFRKFDVDPLYGQSVSYQVATHMLQTETCGYIRFKERFVSMLMSLFAFLFITLFTNMITTSKVSRRSFFAFDTYEKILANKSVQPIWVDTYSFDHHWYSDAPEGSPQRKIWDQSVRISEEAKAHGKFKPSVIPVDMSLLSDFMYRALVQDFVLFLSSISFELSVTIGCSVYPGVPGSDVLSYKGQRDPYIEPSLYVLPVSVFSKVTDNLNIIFKFGFEHGIIADPITRSLAVEQIEELLMKKARKNEKYFQCLQYHKFPDDQVETVPLDLASFIHLFYLFLASCAVGVAMMVHETRTHKKKKRG